MNRIGMALLGVLMLTGLASAQTTTTADPSPVQIELDNLKKQLATEKQKSAAYEKQIQTYLSDPKVKEGEFIAAITRERTAIEPLCAAQKAKWLVVMTPDKRTVLTGCTAR